MTIWSWRPAKTCKRRVRFEILAFLPNAVICLRQEARQYIHAGTVIIEPSVVSCFACIARFVRSDCQVARFAQRQPYVACESRLVSLESRASLDQQELRLAVNQKPALRLGAWA
jgi:hypothetical protein